MAVSRTMELEAQKYPPRAKDRPSVYDPTPYLNGPRHEFLTECVPSVNPRTLSRAVDLAMKRSDPCLRHCNPPLLALQEAAPNIYAPIVDTTKASEVFGRRVLPKLRSDLDSADTDEVVRAISAVSDIVHDPEKVCEAVRVQLAEKMVQLMQHENPRIRERSCAVVETLAGYPVGRDAVLEEPYMLPVLKALMFDMETAVRFRAALTLRVLARFRLGPYDMDEADLAPFLVHLLLWEVVHEIIAAHLSALQLFLEMDSTKEVASGAMECMSRLASCTLGKLVGDQLGIVGSVQLRILLLSPEPDLARSAAMLAMNLTHTIQGKHSALYAALIEPLLELAKHRANRGTQLCALQTLTNMAENPPAREYLLEIEDDLEELEVGDDDTENVRQRLLAVVRWKP